MTHAERIHAELVEDALRAIERVYEDESVSERTALASLDRLADAVAASLGCLREMSAEADPDWPTHGQPLTGVSPMEEVRVFDDLSPFLDVDMDFEPHKFTLYLEKDTGRLLTVYLGDKHAAMAAGRPAEKDNAKKKRQIRANRANYFEVPLPDHGERRKWFREFLARIGQADSFVGSIGGWLEEYGDDKSREQWREVELKNAEEWILAEAERDGVTLILKHNAAAPA